MKAAGLVFTFLLGILGARSASADPVVLVSTLGPGDSFASHATFFGAGEEAQDGRFNFSRAMAFVPGVTAKLTTIEMALEFPWFVEPHFTGGTLEVNLFESRDGLPGSLLESFTSSGTHLPGELSEFQSALQPQLVAGLMYFLEARAIGLANGLWFGSLGEIGIRVPDYYRTGDGPWQGTTRLYPDAAFRVSGEMDLAPVPEPATMVLIGSGLAMAALRRRGNLRAPH